ncbi:MAG: glycosyltransferase family 4 protein [Candidatus Njordarchaeia archaeon]
MRIVLASDFFFPRSGGISVHLEHLAKYLVRSGHRVYIVTTSGVNPCLEVADDGFGVIRLPFPLYSNLLIPKRELVVGLRHVIERVDPDLVNVHHAFSPVAVSIPRALSNYSLPKVLTNHSVSIGFDAYRNHQLFRIARILSTYTVLRSIRGYDRVIAVSKIAADFIQNFIDKPVDIIPNGVDLEEFEVRGSKGDFGLDDDTNLIIMVGRSTLKKGYELGLYVFKQLLKIYPNSMLLIAGPSGWIAKYIMITAKIFGIQDRVKVLGFIPRVDLIKLYKAADVFLHLPWGGESFGIVLLEAMASKTPIVASSGDGLKYILEKSGAGLIVTSYNPQEIVNSIVKVLKDDELRERLITNGERFVKQYSWDRLVRKVLHVYKSVLD